LTAWRILGPVEVTAGGRVLGVQRPQQRAVLALLLLHAGHVVSARQIESALWAGTAPQSARTQVQVCVSRIRAALRDGGLADALTSHAGGYRLTPGAGELDLAEFGALVRAAQADADAGRHACAVPALRAALALWRGPALAGASGDFVEATAAALDEQRLTAYEQLAGVELALGRPDAVMRALGPLAGAHPLRERLVAQLMLALAGCGQQSQALRLFAQTRSLLAERLGLEPGADLAAAQLRVLRQQVVGPVAATAPTPPAPPARPAPPAPPAPPAQSAQSARSVVPAQLPTDVTGFTGREAAQAF